MGVRGLEAERIEDHRAVAQRNGERISDGKEQFDSAISAVRGSSDLIALGKDGRGEDRFTSRQMIETEQRLQRASELIAERERHGVNQQDREGALARAETRGLVLSGEQRAAFEHVTDGRGLSVVVGYAGTGKSAMLGVAREVWESAGYRGRSGA
jgi:ATP-dependent exoDNAse (exonuclease V) alpha subunit